MRAWTGHEKKPASMSPCLRRSRRVFAAPRRLDRARPSGAWSARVDGHEQSRRVFAALAASSPRLADQESPPSSPRKPQVGGGCIRAVARMHMHALGVLIACMCGHVRTTRGKSVRLGRLPKAGGWDGREKGERRKRSSQRQGWSFKSRFAQVRRSGGVSAYLARASHARACKPYRTRVR